jgi:hypothetical protein
MKKQHLSAAQPNQGRDCSRTRKAAPTPSMSPPSTPPPSTPPPPPPLRIYVYELPSAVAFELDPSDFRASAAAGGNGGGGAWVAAPQHRHALYGAYREFEARLAADAAVRCVCLRRDACAVLCCVLLPLCIINVSTPVKITPYNNTPPPPIKTHNTPQHRRP